MNNYFLYQPKLLSTICFISLQDKLLGLSSQWFSKHSPITFSSLPCYSPTKHLPTIPGAILTATLKVYHLFEIRPPGPIKWFKNSVFCLPYDLIPGQFLLKEPQEGERAHLLSISATNGHKVLPGWIDSM